MNRKKREGDFYASKVRLFLNEYGGINLEEFCRAERVSYSKMCNCLGRPSYRRPSVNPENRNIEEPVNLLPGIELQPLVLDVPKDSDGSGQTSVPLTSKVREFPSSGLSDVVLHFGKGLVLHIGKCSAKSLATFMKEMEVNPC
ncbi:hypothetical protein [Parabacteroides sp. ZJ-118]|uniref:hypothetical protein n=1 Tax=Parabacteroides sp. ZJ-118 TaxID=2709398 RepID=UPI0013EA8181|nr:hypothetical protein [Parabacteroides sp. ZJ-118]